MTAVSTTGWANFMKNKYGSKIHDQENNDIKLLELFNKNTSTHNYNGETWIEAVKLERMAGTGARASTSATLPTSIISTDLNATIAPRVDYASVLFDGPTFARMSGNNDGAFIEAKTYAMTSLLQDFNKFRNQTLQGDGSGRRALVNQATPSTSLVIDGIDGLSAPNDGWETNTASNATRRFSVGRRITVRAPTGGFRTNTGPITGITASTNTLTLSTLPTSTADNDEILFEAESDGTNTGVTGSYTIMGMLGIVDDGTLVGTFQNISRSTYPKWQASVDSNSGSLRPYDLQLLSDMATTIDEACGIDVASDNYCLYGHPTVMTQVAHDGLAANRGALGDAKSGYASLPTVAVGHGFVPFKTDVDATPNRLFVLNKKYLDRWVAESLNWDNNSGAVLKDTGGADGTATDTFRAYLRCQDNFGTLQPNAHGVISDIATQ